MTSTYPNAVQPVSPVGNPTLALKQNDPSSIPDVSVITEADLHKYVYTGYKVVINTPVTKNSLGPLFTINLDGFIPSYSIFTDWGSAIKNLTPVQPTTDSKSFVKVFQEQIMLPIQHLYYSNRFTMGKVNVGLRISSNTSQSGNFFIAQGTSMVRKYYDNTTKWDGVDFINTSAEVTDFSTNNFALLDASLNRQFSIKPTRRNPTKAQDMLKKIVEVKNCSYGTLAQNLTSNVIASQFAEDHLLVGILGNLPDQNANQITISIFFDYSDVSFAVPVMPIIPAPPSVQGKRQLDFNATVDVVNPTKATAVFSW